MPHLLWHGTSVYLVSFEGTPHSVASYNICKEVSRIYSFLADFHGSPFSRLLRHTRGCGGTILTRILRGAFCCLSFYTVFIFCNLIQLILKLRERTRTGSNTWRPCTEYYETFEAWETWKKKSYLFQCCRQQNNITLIYLVKRKSAIKMKMFIYKSSLMHPDLAYHRSSVDSFPIDNFYKWYCWLC